METTFWSILRAAMGILWKYHFNFIKSCEKVLNFEKKKKIKEDVNICLHFFFRKHRKFFIAVQQPRHCRQTGHIRASIQKKNYLLKCLEHRHRSSTQNCLRKLFIVVYGPFRSFGLIKWQFIVHQIFRTIPFRRTSPFLISLNFQESQHWLLVGPLARPIMRSTYKFK